MLLEKIVSAIKNPEYYLYHILTKGKFDIVSDKKYLQLLFKKTMGYKLNLKDPKRFNEKLQWLKLYNQNPLYTKLVDKYEVRKYVSEKAGEQYLNTIYGVYDNFDQIDFSKLPNEFVLKATHTSGDYFICKDKEKIDYLELRNKVNTWLKRDYYSLHKEWPYKNVKRKIISEKLLRQEKNQELRDYRFFCFDGEPKFIAVDFSITDKSKTRRNLYNLNWELQKERISYPREENIILEKPDKLNKMIEISRKLSKDLPHARVDFYYLENQIIFGEITLFHQAGLGKIYPDDFDHLMGSWIKLPKNEEGESNYGVGRRK